MSGLSTATIALILAGISAVVSLSTEISRRRSSTQLAARQAADAQELENHKDSLMRAREAEAKITQSQQLVAHYRDPLLLSAFDLQSRIFNVLRPGGFRGGRDPDYFVMNTLFLIGQFFGWLEILRRDMQFLDLGAVEETRELSARIERVQQLFASTSGSRDAYYIYRGEQRAIGEVMTARLDNDSDGSRPECIGYAAFVAKQSEPDFARWFERLGGAIADLPGGQPRRLLMIQNALIDIIDFLDPEKERFTRGRERLRPRTAVDD